MPPCRECGWAEPGYSCDGTSTAPGCKLKLIDLSDKIMDALTPDHTSDSAYEGVIEAIEAYFGVEF